MDEARSHREHVCLRGHWQIDKMLTFRNLLRDNRVVRQQYQDMKLQLEATNREGIGEYFVQQAPFIDAR